ARRRRLQRKHGRACPAQILVGCIDDDVGVGRIVDRRDLPVTETDTLVDQLHNRGEGIGCAGRRGNQAVACGIIKVLVDADDDVERGCIFDRCGYDDAFDAAVEIGLELLGFQELTRALQDNVAAKLLPGHLSWSDNGREADALAANADGPLGLNLDCRAPAAMDAIEFEEMRRGIRPTLDLVDVDDIEVVCRARITLRAWDRTERGPESEAPHTPHSIDSHPHIASYTANLLLSPSSSKRALSAIRSSDRNGKLVNASRRRRIMP